MTKFRPLIIILSAFALSSLNSCDNDDEGNTLSPSLLETQTINELIVKNGSLSSLEAALGVASGDLPGTLSGSEAYTVFAPNNEAFSALASLAGFESSDDMLAEISPELLAKILSYHVVAGESDIADLTDGKSLSAVAGGNLTITSSIDGDNKIVQILDATKVEQTNPVASIKGTLNYGKNGIVHIIDKVLYSQEIITALEIDTRPSILEWATSTEDLSSLVDALKKAGLADTVTGLEESTVLAPNNAAFTNLFSTLGDDYNSLEDFDNAAEIAFLGDILKYHIITSRIESTELTAGPAETALQDSSVDVISEGGSFTFGDASTTNASIVTADIDGRNGFVHIIDKVLVPQTAVDFLANLDSGDIAAVVGRTLELSLLEEALIATDLVETFTDLSNESFVQGADEKDEDFEKRRAPENYTYFNLATVFAPSDAAFIELLDLLGDDYTGIDSFDTEEEKELLKEIIMYHVVPGKTSSADLTAGVLTTASGEDIEVIEVFGTDTFNIGNSRNNVIANIVTPDVAARNGLAHVIDKVLLPENAIIFIRSLDK